MQTMFRRSIILFVMLCLGVVASAQPTRVRGRVTDSEGNPLEFASVAFVGCGGDDSDGPSSSSALVGTWDLITLEVDGESIPLYSDCTVKFTETTMTIYDEMDLFDGVPVEYEYKGNTIWIAGIGLWKVLSLTDTLLKVDIDGDINTFQKRG